MKEKEQRKVEFVVPVELYDAYRKYCRENGVLPATDLKRHIMWAITNAITQQASQVGLKLLSLNMHMRNTPFYSLPYAETEEKRVDAIAKIIMEEKPDAACLTEWTPAWKGTRLAEQLEQSGYRIYYPEQNMDFNLRKRMWCVTILAVREELVFEQHFMPEQDGFPLHRIVYGILHAEDKAFAVAAVHVPCVGDETSEKQVERKRLALESLNRLKEKFQEEEYPVILLGDFNVDEKEDICLEEYKNLDMVDVMPEENTREDQRLDHILINGELQEEYEFTGNVDRSLIKEGLTDHALLTLVLSRKKEVA